MLKMKTTAQLLRSTGRRVLYRRDDVTYSLFIVIKHHKANLYSHNKRLCEWNHGPQSHFPRCCSLHATVRLSSKGWWVPAGRHVDSEPPHGHCSSIPTSQFPSNNEFPNKQDQLGCPDKKGGRQGHGLMRSSNTAKRKDYSLTALPKNKKDHILWSFL